MWRDTGRQSGALATGWRFFVGLFFVGSAIFNLMVTFADPQPVYSAFADLAWPLAETLIRNLLIPIAGLFTLGVVVFELATGLLVLHRGRVARWGLAAAVAWLVALIPFLGLYGIVNLAFAAAILPLFGWEPQRSLLGLLLHRARSGSGRQGIRVIGIYQVTVGTGVVGWWAAMLVSGTVPEIEAGDAAIWFHLAAEGVMSLLLICGGWIVAHSSGHRGRSLSALAAGSLIYSTMNSAGYFAETGDWPLVLFFGAIFLMTSVAVLHLLGVIGSAEPDEGTPHGGREQAREHFRGGLSG